jgi:3-oxoacyl-[acyl-carrier-protein] synthase-1
VCGDSTEKIADDLGLTGFVSTLSTACSSSANAIMRGAEMIQKKVVPRIIAGGTDALSRFTFNGFRSLMILSKAPSRPFDAHRDGLNLGEGAAYLILEGEASVRGREEKILGEVAGFGNANDAFHQTASSPEGEGAWRAMSSALHNAGLSLAEIDLVNAHGTGTPNNDLSELRGLVHLFGEDLPPFSSTKPYTGHTLGAAGAIEAVFSVFSLIHQVVFPNLNFKDKMEEVPVLPETNLLTDKELNTILSNSFGFGGNDTSLIFRRHEGIH